MYEVVSSEREHIGTHSFQQRHLRRIVQNQRQKRQAQLSLIGSFEERVEIPEVVSQEELLQWKIKEIQTKEKKSRRNLSKEAMRISRIAILKG